MDIVTFNSDLQKQVNSFLKNVFRLLEYHIHLRIDMLMWQM